MTVCKLECTFQYFGTKIKYITSINCDADVDEDLILKRFIRDHKISGDKMKSKVKLISYQKQNKIGL